jgi:three-Cys-motif partner protein
MASYPEIGEWSEAKLDLIREYGRAYSTIMSHPKRGYLHHVYIDAFAGSGTHVARSTGQHVRGSPLNALNVEPPFEQYYFIDKNPNTVRALSEAVGHRSDVILREGDANTLLLDEVYPRMSYENYTRALCLLDPYGLDLQWQVIETAGRMRTIEIFLNFPIMDMNRNVFLLDTTKMDAAQKARMDVFWGGDTWRPIMYGTQEHLFGTEEIKIGTNDTIAAAFRQRLKTVANFEYVPEPVVMRNSKRAMLYYLFFASQKPAAEHIVTDIFAKYRPRLDPPLF